MHCETKCPLCPYRLGKRLQEGASPQELVAVDGKELRAIMDKRGMSDYR